MSVSTMCPRNCGRPSRRVRVARPVVGIPRLATLCRECWLAESCGPDRRGRYRTADRAKATKKGLRTRARNEAQQIDRRFARALVEIRRRRAA